MSLSILAPDPERYVLEHHSDRCDIVILPQSLCIVAWQRHLDAASAAFDACKSALLALPADASAAARIAAWQPCDFHLSCADAALGYSVSARRHVDNI